MSLSIKPPQRLLTKQEVLYIRKALKPKKIQTDIARELGVTQATISNVLRGKTYKSYGKKVA